MKDEYPLHEHQHEKFLEALAEAYRLQEAIISATDFSIFSTDNNGLLTSFNKAAEALLGYDAAEVLNKNSALLFHDLKEVEERARELSKELGTVVKPGFDVLVTKPRLQNLTYKREWTYIHKNGKRIPVLLSTTALRDEKGLITGYAGIAIDISEQKKIEQRIKESEANLQSLVSSLDEIVFELDDKGRFNKIWVKSDDYLFLPKEKIYGHTLSEMFGEPFAKPFDIGLQHVLETGETFNHEYRSMIKGDDRWFNAKYSLIFDNGIPTRRVSVCIQDITARKKAEISLRESEEKFRFLAENIPGVVYLCKNDASYSMIFLNEHVEKLTGYPAQEFIHGKINFTELYHPDDTATIFTAVDEALQHRKSFHLEYRLRHRTLGYRWISESGVGIFEGDRAVLIEGYLFDITERKDAEDEMMRMAEENNRVFNHSINLNVIASFDGYFKKVNPA
jgi:PAS domain S-box-containing protein